MFPKMTAVVVLALALPVIALAQEFPARERQLPRGAKTAWETAVKKVEKNRKTYDEANEKALATLQRELERANPAVNNIEELVKEFQNGIVQLDASASPPALAPSEQNVFKAPNGHRYKFIRESLSWEDAQKKCVDLGGHLMTLETRAEHDVISQWVKNGFGANRNQFGAGASVWMGGQEVEVRPGDKQWRWVTGEPITFTAWRGHHPHRVEQNRDYLTLSLERGDWVNFWGEKHPDTFFICEWDK